MQQKLLETLKKENNRLRDIIARASTLAILRRCAWQLLDLYRTKGIIGAPLFSPFKQVFHVLGLMLTNQEGEASQIEQATWNKVIECLNTIFVQYSHMFFPDPKDKTGPTGEWIRHRRLAMPFFLNYFNTFPLLSQEQVFDRIRSWFGPFSSAIEHHIGLTPENVLEIASWILDKVQTTFDRLQEDFRKARKEQQLFIQPAEREEWTLHQMRANASGSPVATAMRKFVDSGNQAFCFDPKSLETRFPGAAQKFLEVFSARRGQFPDYYFPTDENPAELHPVFLLENGTAFLSSANMLVFACMRRLDALLRESSTRDAYFRHRDREVQRKATVVFKNFLPSEATVYENVFETPDAYFEHDILIHIGTTFLVVEAKASSPRQPFRDPDKAFVRLRDDFRRESGIQGAFDQACRLRSLLLTGNCTLYRRDGREILKISSVPTEVFCICVTGESYASLATDLSQLLEKKEEQPYPWVVSVYDLETMLSGFRWVGKDLNALLEFLGERTSLHGKVFGTDELEFAGIFCSLVPDRYAGRPKKVTWFSCKRTLRTSSMRFMPESMG